MITKEKLQEILEPVWHEAQKLSLQMNNINTTADIAGFKIDWEKGKVLDK